MKHGCPLWRKKAGEVYGDGREGNGRGIFIYCYCFAQTGEKGGNSQLLPGPLVDMQARVKLNCAMLTPRFG